MAKIGLIKLKNLTESLLDFVKQDYEDHVIAGTSEESFLLRSFDEDDVADGIDYKELAVEIFTRNDLENRKVEVKLMFDRERATLPTIHVREPAKNKGLTDAIGYIDEELIEDADGSFHEQRRRSFGSQFELMITSANRHEVLIIEEVLMGLLIGAHDTLALANPFYQFNFTVKELIANNELVPNPLFIKAIGVNVSYDKTFQDLSTNNLLNKILFTHNILSE